MNEEAGRPFLIHAQFAGLDLFGQNRHRILGVMEKDHFGPIKLDIVVQLVDHQRHISVGV